MKDIRLVYAALFLSSLSVLSFEILLVRIFSVIFSYHLASMVVSVAMLGVAASGTVLAALREVRGKTLLRPWYFLILGLVMVAAYAAASRLPFDPVKLSWDGWQLMLISCYYLVFSLPFFVSGFILASAFASLGERSGQLYASDLCGAAAGTVAVFVILSRLDPDQAVLCAAAAAMLGAVLTGGLRLRLLAAGFMVIFLLSAIFSPVPIGPPISPYKELPSLLRMTGAEPLATLHSPFGRADLFRSPGIRYAPGLSLRYRGKLPEQVGLSIDGGSVTTVTLLDSGESSAFLDYLPTSIAYRLRPSGDVFLIDPRGGLPLLLARRSGADRTDCSESNPAIPAILEGQKGELPVPCRRTGLGRNFIGRSKGLYDIIDFPLTGSMPSVHAGAGEDYRLTVEAVNTYLGGLKEDGILVLSLYINPPYRSELRLLNTVLAALEEAGAEDPGSHVAALRSLGLLCLLVRRTPFPEKELAAVRDFAGELWFDPVWFSGISPEETNEHIRSRGEDLAAAYAALVDERTRETFVRGHLFDISPATDNQPYFHDTLRFDTLGEVYDLVGGKMDFFIGEGYLLPAALAQVIFLGFLLILIPVFLAGRRSARGGGRPLAYFASIGLGYMLVEIGLIQRLLIVLEHPVSSFALVLSALLVSSGLGSLASRRLPARHLWKTALAAALLALFYRGLLPPLSVSLSGLPLPFRAAAILLFLFPAGFLMGMPFPGGVRWLAEGRRRLIPWAWAVNGFFSVLGPLIAALVARKAGFGGVFLLAAAAYFGAALAGAGFCASPTMGTNRTPPI